MRPKQPRPNFTAIRVSFIHRLCSIDYLLAYGKCGEDVSKHTTTRIVHDHRKLTKLQAKAMFVSDNFFLDESGTVSGYEVRMNKSIINDSKPVHISAAILQWSKILFIK